MMSTNNILHPASGEPIIVPSQDIVLGLYYLSIISDNQPGEGMILGSAEEVRHALDAKVVSLHAKVKGRHIAIDRDGNEVVQIQDTTPGRMLLAELLPKRPNVEFDLINQLLTKKAISRIINAVYRACGQKETVVFCDRIMALGFNHAFKAGISFGKVMPALRIALTGAMGGPDLFETIAIIGTEPTVARINKAVDTLA